MKERKQPGETNSALCGRLGYLGKLANIKEVSGNDLLLMRFTACCDDKALRRDIFKIKDLTWESLIVAVNRQETASRIDTVMLTRDKLFKMNISNAGSSGRLHPPLRGLLLSLLQLHLSPITHGCKSRRGRSAQPQPQHQNLCPRNLKETETEDLGEHLETGAVGHLRTGATEHQETGGPWMEIGDLHLMVQGHG